LSRNDRERYEKEEPMIKKTRFLFLFPPNVCSVNLKSAIRNSQSAILAGALLLALSFSAEAQQPARVARVGYLHGSSKSDFTDAAVMEGLRSLGYVIGKDLTIDYRYAEGKLDRFPELAADLVRMNVDVIVAVSDVGARAAKNATKTIPIVMVGVGTDPVEVGLIEAFARPGGNITGLTLIAVEIAGKRLELFKETVPKTVRVAVLYDPANRGNLAEMKEVQTAAPSLALSVQSLEVRGPEGFEPALAVLSRERPDGIYVPGGPLMNTHYKRVADSALKNRLPSVFVRRDAVDAGGLMSYGVDYAAHYRRVAYFVDKVLKGAKPADLPVERPTKFELVINLKTAKQIGLTIPPQALARADRVIK
jgi:putative ABC transport system substrate-binding protein